MLLLLLMLLLMLMLMLMLMPSGCHRLCDTWILRRKSPADLKRDFLYKPIQ